MKNPEADILKYLLGSRQYKVQHEEDFLSAVETLPPKDLHDLLTRTHLTGNFFDTDVADNKAHDIPSIRNGFAFQKLIQEIIQRELVPIIENARNLSLSPILLKGTGLWHEYYNAGIRRVRDLDIQLYKYEEIRSFSELLLSEGFEQEEEKTEGPQYEMGEFVKRINLKFDDRQRSIIESLVDSYYFSGFSQAGNLKYDYVFDLIVEPHFAPFVYKDGSFPVIKPDYLVGHSHFEGAYLYRNFVQAPYLAMKIMFDMEELVQGNTIKQKAFKLIADFVRILQSMSESDIAKSVAVSNAWGTSPYYTECLHYVKTLMPEVVIRGLSAKSSSLMDRVEACI